MHFRQVAVAISCLAAASCSAPAPQPTPPPPRVAVAPRPTPTPAPVNTTASANWMDVGMSAGDWRYRPTATGSIATYVDFSVACERGKWVSLIRQGPFSADAPMTIRTESVSRTLTGVAGPGSTGLTANLMASDPLLDAIAFSKGRFAVEAPGIEPRYLPSWPEVTRVIEDCR